MCKFNARILIILVLRCFSQYTVYRIRSLRFVLPHKAYTLCVSYILCFSCSVVCCFYGM